MRPAENPTGRTIGAGKNAYQEQRPHNKKTAGQRLREAAIGVPVKIHKTWPEKSRKRKETTKKGTKPQLLFPNGSGRILQNSRRSIILKHTKRRTQRMCLRECKVWKTCSIAVKIRCRENNAFCPRSVVVSGSLRNYTHYNTNQRSRQRKKTIL